MHDPKTVAFDIKNPFAKKRHDYRPTLITIWHNDPETDHSDDSCGWFIRLRHVNKDLVEKVREEIEYHFKHNYWFDENGKPIYSVIGTTINIYSCIVWQFFMFENNGKPNRKKYNSFMNKHLFDIINFAENHVDSLFSAVTNKYNQSPKEQEYELLSICLPHIMRMKRKWYQHPKWHFWHWSFQIHPIQKLKRRYWDKCCICHKRGFKGSAHGNWSGDKIWHSECDDSHKRPQPNNQ